MSVLSDCDKARRLYIAVPAYDAKIGIRTAQGLLEAGPELAAIGVEAQVGFLSGHCYIEQVRNKLTKAFLASDATDMLFVDADVGFEGSSVAIIAAARRCIVGGLYPKKNPKVEFPVLFPKESLTTEVDGLLEASFLPTGFLRINRSVFEALAPTMPVYKDDDGSPITSFFHCGIRDGKYWGEDWQFCHDWIALGGKCYIVPELDFSHMGYKFWEGNWGKYAKSQMLAKAAE